jgi:hypothetical protein
MIPQKNEAFRRVATAKRKLHPVRRKVSISAMPIWLAVSRKDFTVW